MRSLVEPSAPPSPAGERSRVAAADWNGTAGWLRAESLLALAVTFVVGMRLVVVAPLLLTAGDLLAVGLAPLWLPVTRRYVGARLLLLMGCLTIVAGVFLTVVSSDNHRVRTLSVLIAATLIVSVLASLGFLLWAREKIGIAPTAIVFALGMLVAVSKSGGQYAANPWRFGFSVGVTILLLGLCALGRSHVLALVVAIVLCVVSALTDARSSFSLLLLTAALLAWQLRPLKSTLRASGTRALLGLAILAAAIYNVGQALILNGYLGVKTQQRSLQQVDETGSLILGGRPELAATLALMRDSMLGFGMGTQPNHHDVTVAKTGMAAIGYDPNNGYVEDFMFGHGFSLHSFAGDLWVQGGVVGLAFAVVIVVLAVHGAARQLTLNAASGLLLYISLKTAWNFFFGPLYSSLTVLELALALGLAKRSSPSSPSLDSESSGDVETASPADAVVSRPR